MTAAAADRYVAPQWQTEYDRGHAFRNAQLTHHEVRMHIMAGNIAAQTEALAELRAARTVLATAHSALLRAMADTDRMICGAVHHADR